MQRRSDSHRELALLNTASSMSCSAQDAKSTQGPGKDGEWKVPTRLAYSKENNDLHNNAWGYEVEPKMTSCSWTKLLLDINAKDRTYDDPNLQRAVDQGMLHLPPDTAAQQVCSDFLKELHAYMTSRMVKQASSAIVAATPVDCWLTVPAVWSDQAQMATKLAAQAAGFGSRPQDTINIISEPEAAAIAALKKYQGSNAYNPIRVSALIASTTDSPADESSERRGCAGVRLRRWNRRHHNLQHRRDRSTARVRGAVRWRRYDRLHVWPRISLTTCRWQVRLDLH